MLVVVMLAPPGSVARMVKVSLVGPPLAASSRAACVGVLKYPRFSS
jgi:hypothetical protein